MGERSGMYWRDKPIEELTREELMAALKVTATHLAEYQTLENMHALALGKVEMIKRGDR